MDPFTIAAGITSTVGAILGFSGAKKAERAAKRQAREEARVEEMVTRERVRQIGRQETIMRAETRALAAQAGVKVESGSVLEVLADQAAEFRRERDITETVGASRVAGVIERAETIAEGYKYTGYASLFSGLASAAGHFLSASPSRSDTTETPTRRRVVGIG